MKPIMGSFGNLFRSACFLLAFAVFAIATATNAEAASPIDNVVLLTHDRGAGVPYYLRRAEDATRAPLKSFVKRPRSSFAKAQPRAPKKKITRCFHYVKKYLLEEGLVNGWLPGRSAFHAAKILPQHGFKNTGLKPHNSNIGDVCVYRGGKHGHGHIEVLTKEGWWYGYGFNTNSVQGRRFIGCYNKKGKVPSALPVQPPAHEIAGETDET